MSLRFPPRDAAALRTADDLTALWRRLIVAPPFTDRSLWLLFIDAARRPLGPLVRIEDLPDGPYDEPAGGLVELCQGLLDGPGDLTSVAFLLSRSGQGPWHIGDRAWARFLQGVVAALPEPRWPIHRAHDHLLEVASGTGAARRSA